MQNPRIQLYIQRLGHIKLSKKVAGTLSREDLLEGIRYTYISTEIINKKFVSLIIGYLCCMIFSLITNFTAF